MSWLFGNRKSRLKKPDWQKRPNQSLDAPMLLLNKSGDAIFWRDAMTNIFFTGSVGSGKSSALLHLAASAMRGGASVVCFTVKPTDAAEYSRLAEKCGRSPVIYRPLEQAFNPVKLMLEHTEGTLGSHEKIVSLIMDTTKRLQSGSATGDAGFFIMQAEHFVSQLVTLAIAGGVIPSFKWILDCMNSVPQSKEEAAGPQWQASCPVCEAIRLSHQRELSDADKADRDSAAKWWLQDVVKIPSKTMASIVLTLQGPLSQLTRNELGQILNDPGADFDPGFVSETPTVLIIDASTQEYGELGVCLQRMIKRALFESLKTRDVDKHPFPVMIVQDEVQELLDAHTEPELLRTMRSRRVGVVMATQTISNITLAVGQSPQAEAISQSICGLPGVKIIMANTDPETLSWCERTLTSTPQMKTSFGTKDQSIEEKKGQGKSSGKTSNFSIEYQPSVHACEIAQLKTGGPANKGIVECFITKLGPPFKSGKTNIKVAFKQINL